ncbi:MAG: YraN family protein [Clostridia bacterium]|nr:YraN family protein [Clostridia bacterium]
MKVYGLGLKGEQIARKYLLKKGYKIIATNFQCRFGELDLIAQDQNCLVFCEVKTRSAGMVAAPQESVTPAKQRKMIKTAEHWLMENPVDAPLRFDVLAVFPDSFGKWTVEHLENVIVL